MKHQVTMLGSHIAKELTEIDFRHTWMDFIWYEKLRYALEKIHNPPK